MTKRILLILFALSLILAGCSKKQVHTIDPAFYFWQSNFDLSPNELNYLKELNVHKLYVRFFDVDWNPYLKTPMPAGDVRIVTDSLKNIEIVPAVFITNRTLSNINDTSIQNLAEKIFEKITGKLNEFKNPEVKEFQLDCDWTKKTKYKYFNLIEDIKKLSAVKNISVTATIRLHQVKYFKLTGVPPVKRGMLMFYNMSDVLNFRTRNSIYDPEIAENYLTNFDEYPLQLDVVLPAFSWGVLFRGEKIISIMNDLTKDELLKDPGFKKIDDTHFRVMKNKIFEGRHLFKFDTIRLEEITPEITKSAAGLIAPQIRNGSLTVAIYHLNKKLIKNYEPKDIQNCFSAFR